MEYLYKDGEFVDDISGKSLQKDLVIEARLLELGFFRDLEVYTKVDREPWMRPITTKWLDINKGDRTNPNYRSRLVGRELNLYKRDDLFAGTPPLESLRMIMSRCSSRKNHVVMAVDVKRAYFYAPATRPIFIEIPVEEREHGDEARVGRLNLSLYGTRDAAMNWVAAYTKVLEDNGFKKGRYSAQNFYHEKRDIALSVHGDDFSCTGPEHQMQWLKGVFQKAYEVKVEILGPDPAKGHLQEVRVLNRVLTWNSWGLGYEADPRHAEIVLQELGMEEAKSVTTPGTKDDAARAHKENGEEFTWLEPVDEKGTAKENAGKELTGAAATRYRAICARLNYLSQDRPDIRYACKEASRWMAKPQEGHWVLLKRVARYLKGTPRLLQRFIWQEAVKSAVTFVDSDLAGCKRTCRSTSGGAVMLGAHTVMTWSATQAVVALSSGEAELYALTKGAANTLGMMSLGADLGMIFHGHVRSDASAAIGMVNRTGAGKLRHVRVQYLWIQDMVRCGDLALSKVPGEETRPTC
jgi:hypothetical protein